MFASGLASTCNRRRRPRSATWCTWSGTAAFGFLRFSQRTTRSARSTSAEDSTIGPIVLFADGRPHDDRAPEAANYLKGDDIAVSVDLGAGRDTSTVWTCDLSAEYVKINAEYRT